MQTSTTQTRQTYPSPSADKKDRPLPGGNGLGRLSTLPQALLAGLLFVTPAAMAHHPMDGQVPQTFWHGLLSGLAHPVIAVDHLSFMLALAVLVALSVHHLRHAIAPLLAFGAMASAGVVVQAGAPMLPGVEWVIGGALCAVALGLWAWRTAAPLVKVWGAAAAGAVGLAHGLAYGEAVIGAEPTPIAAYMVGLACVQLVVMIATVWTVHKLVERQSRHLAAFSRALACAAGLAGLWVLGTAALG